MRQVNMLEAKSNLSRLVDAVESGQESEIVIARHGKPAARIVPMGSLSKAPRLGVAKGKYVMPPTIDQDNEHIRKLFEGEPGGEKA